MVTHPGTNRVWRSASTLIEANVLPLSQTANCHGVKRLDYEILVIQLVCSYLPSIFVTRCYAYTWHMPSRGVHRLSISRSVCLFVRLAYSVENSKHIFRIFSPSGSHTILVFPYQTLWQYSDGNPPPNWGKNRDFQPTSGFGIDHCCTVACCQHFDHGI